MYSWGKLGIFFVYVYKIRSKKQYIRVALSVEIVAIVMQNGNCLFACMAKVVRKIIYS